MYIFYSIFITTRIFIFLELDEKGFFKVENNSYLNQNFFELFFFNYTIPNGHLLIEKILNYSSLNISSLYYFLNISYTLIFCFFLNDILQRIILNKNLRISLLILVATILIPYETWRVGHHDHINLFIISYLFWSLFRFIYHNKKFNHLIVGLILINLFYTLGFVFFFIILFSSIFIKKITKTSMDKNHYVKFVTLFTFILLIFAKNYITVSIFSSSSMGGANLIQRTIHALGEKEYKNLIQFKNETFPVWWKNIYEEVILNNYIENSEDIRISNLAHGKLDKDIFLNFQKQKKLIQNSDYLEPNVQTLLDRDTHNFKFRQWIYNYGYQENLISTKYQSFGSKIFYEACKTYPIQMLIGNIGNKGIILTSLQMISYGGLMPNYYEPNKKYSNSFLIILINTTRVLIILSLLMIPLILMKKIDYKNLMKIDIFYLILIFTLFLIVILSSTITCCENSRMMVMLFFVIVLISVINFIYISKYFSFKKNENNCFWR